MLIQIVYWHWLALAVFLLIVEILAPGMFFLWMAQASLITGIALYLFSNMGWQAQVLIFSIISVVGIVAAKRYVRHHPTESDQPLLNRRTAQYVGRIFTLEQPIINGQGKIKVDDSTWKIQGDDCPSGSKVKVVGADSVVLLIEKVD